MKRLLIAILLSVCAYAQNPTTAVYPNSVATDANLTVACSRVNTTTTGSLTNVATSVAVADATGLLNGCTISIGSEDLLICGISGTTLSFGKSACPNVDGRGLDGSGAVSHASGSRVVGNITRLSHNALAAEVKAIELVGGNFVGPVSATADDLIAFNGTTGKLGKDAGLTTANAADAITKKHAQNTDTGTTATCFQLAVGASGPKLCSDGSGGYSLKTSADVVLMSVSSAGVATYGDGTAKWELEGITQDSLPSASSVADTFKVSMDRANDLLTWITNGGSRKYVALGKWVAFAGPTAARTYTLPDADATLLATNGSAAALTSFPTLNQNTTGTAAGLAAAYTDWAATSGGSSILNKPSAAVLSKTATYQALAADFSNYKTIVVPSGTFTITLVASGTQPTNGQAIEIVNYGSGVVTIARSGQNINGGTASLTLPASSATATAAAVLWSDGTDYFANVITAGGGATIPALSGDVTNSGNAVTVTKINATSLAGLATGILKNTTTTGVPSIAVAGDFPTLNQSTTGTAGGLSGSALSGDVTNSGNTVTVAKVNGTSFAGLATGILKNTTTTGVPSIAAAGDFPTLNQNTSGTAANVSGTPALPNGTTATTQAADDSTAKLMTTAFYAGQKGTANPVIDGTAAAGTSLKFSPIDHAHPTDTSRVATSVTVNGHALSANVTVSASDLTTGTLPSAQIPTVPLTAGTTASPTGASNYVVCTSTCSVTIPVPAAGTQICVRNGMGVSTVITLSAIGSSAMYEKTDSSAYGTSGTGTMVSGGAVGDKACIVGLDSTHYLTLSYSGTWTVN